MKDVLLEKFFELARWEEAIEGAYAKDIRRSTLKALCSPEVRTEIYRAFKADTICIAPPHEAQIPKDDGTMRTVYANEEIDRVLLAIANNLLLDVCPEMIHPACTSYQKGIGTGKVVTKVSKEITDHDGWKADLSKYFDSVPIEYIDGVFDKIEAKLGKSAIISWLRRYYHSDYVIDIEGKLIEKYTSLKQGCAVASFLANSVLYHVDKKLSEMSGVYYRYSDDMIFIGEDAAAALATLESELSKMTMKLNPKKVEAINGNSWFKFLGFNIKGGQITLSGSRVKKFQKEIEKRTIKDRNASQKSALNNVNRFLYVGDGTYSWATSVLPIVNVEKDVATLNEYVLDSLRAVATGKRKIGGLGSVKTGESYTIVRGTGKNVKANRLRTAKTIEGYMPISAMRNALITDRAAYETLVRQL